jgi:uncharacterized protein YjbJ (UPF0337 family)
MNTNELADNWHQLTDTFKKKWHKLSEDDIKETKGNFETLANKIAERYDINKEKAQRKLKKYMKNLDISEAQMKDVGVKILQYAGTLYDQGQKMMQRSFNFIRQKPLCSAGILIGATALASLLFTKSE